MVALQFVTILLRLLLQSCAALAAQNRAAEIGTRLQRARGTESGDRPDKRMHPASEGQLRQTALEAGGVPPHRVGAVQALPVGGNST
jgi:hypothetical protein